MTKTDSDFSFIKKTCTPSLVLLSLVPFITALIDLYVIGVNSSNFSRNASICSILPLLLPFLLRNYTEVNTEFDYRMCTISNFILISKFFIVCFTDDAYKNLFNKITSGSESNIYIPYIVSLSVDVLLASFDDKTLALCYKILSTIGLMIFIVGNRDISRQNLIIEYSFISFIIFTIPALTILSIGNKRKKLCSVLTMVTFYSSVLSYYIWTIVTKSTNSKAGLFDKASYWLKKIPYFN